jgi:signal transduction histidine kinase
MTTGGRALRRLRRVTAIQRDTALAAGLFAVLLLDAAVGPDGRGIGVLAVVVALGATLPLAARSRWPVWTAVILTAGTAAVVPTLGATDVVSVPVFFALYTVAATGDRRRSLQAAVVVTITVVVVVAASAASAPPQQRLAIAAWNIGFLLVALAVGDAVRWRAAYRVAILERVDHAISEERLRIGRDLHDSIAHAMTAINVQAGAAAHLIDRQPQAAKNALLDIRRVSAEALGDLRGTLGQLRDGEIASLRPTPTIDSLDELADRVRAAGVEVTLNYRGSVDHVAASVDTAAHRIVQEALTNVLRHSGATCVSVEVTVTENKIVLDVSDNGRGSIGAGAKHDSGFGLLGMRERALSVGGSLEASPQPGGGWRVHADLPLAAA